MSPSFRTPAPLLHHWLLLIALRWLSIAGQLAAIGFAAAVLGMALPAPELLAVVCGQLIVNGWSLYRLRRARAERPLGQDTLAFALTLDVLALALQLYLTGGAGNPFASSFLVPVAIAGVMLPVGYTAGFAILTLCLYRSLMENFLPLPEPLHAMPGGLPLHQVGMALNFLLSTVLIAGFVSLLAARLRASQRELGQARERALRQEQILGLGTLAAGTAHELGTPLNTIAVLASELQDQAPQSCREDIRLLQAQVTACKDILTTLVRQVRQAENIHYEISLEMFKDLILSKFNIIKPEIKVDVELVGDVSVARLQADAVLEQAVLNLLNNAADVSPSAVSCFVQAAETELRIDIRDRGPGFTPEVIGQAGGRIVSTKEHGLGIGLLLSHATLERYGGEVSFHARPGGGAVTRVRLPRLGAGPLSRDEED